VHEIHISNEGSEKNVSLSKPSRNSNSLCGADLQADLLGNLRHPTTPFILRRLLTACKPYEETHFMGIKSQLDLLSLTVEITFVSVSCILYMVGLT
jgi:hypothetical protein